MEYVYEGELTIKLSKSVDVVTDDKLVSFNLDAIHKETDMIKEIIKVIEKNGFTCTDNNLSLSKKE